MSSFAPHILQEIEHHLSVAIGNTTVPGTFSLEARIPLLSCPVGVVWFSWVGNSTIEILYSFVHHRARRRGIRTRIHEEMLQAYQGAVTQIMTASASTESEPWLQKMGFKRRQNGDWVFRVPNRRKRRA